MEEIAFLGTFSILKGDFSRVKGSLCISEYNLPFQASLSSLGRGEGFKPGQWFPNLSDPQSPEELL